MRFILYYNRIGVELFCLLNEQINIVLSGENLNLKIFWMSGNYLQGLFADGAGGAEDGDMFLGWVDWADLNLKGLVFVD